MTKVIVSDHAVVRYLERVDGPHPVKENGKIDVAEVRRRILADGREAAFAIGVRVVKIGDVEFCSQPDRNGDDLRVVTTVKTPNALSAQKRPHPTNQGTKNPDGRGKRWDRRSRHDDDYGRRR